MHPSRIEATAKTVVVRCVGRTQLSTLGAKSVAARPCVERCHALHYQPDKWKPFPHLELHNMATKNFRVAQVAPVLGVPRLGGHVLAKDGKTLVTSAPRVLRDSVHNRKLLHQGQDFCLSGKEFHLRTLSLADLKAGGVTLEDHHLGQIVRSCPQLEEVGLQDADADDAAAACAALSSRCPSPKCWLTPLHVLATHLCLKSSTCR